MLLSVSTEKLKLSNCAYARVLEVARTIRYPDGMDVIGDTQVAEAVQYWALDRKYWG